MELFITCKNKHTVEAIYVPVRSKYIIESIALYQ